MAHILDELQRKPRRIDEYAQDDMDAIVRARIRGVTWQAIYDALSGAKKMPARDFDDFYQTVAGRVGNLAKGTEDD